MKRNIIACVLIVACLVAGLITIGQVEAKSSIQTFVISIRQNPTTKHLYFAPTFPGCGDQYVVNVKFFNTSKQKVHVFLNTRSLAWIKPGKSEESSLDMVSPTIFQFDVNTGNKVTGTDAQVFIAACLSPQIPALPTPTPIPMS